MGLIFCGEKVFGRNIMASRRQVSFGVLPTSSCILRERKIISEIGDMEITCVWGGVMTLSSLFSCWWERDSTKMFG